jgi:ACT domain-containing protein
MPITFKYTKLPVFTHRLPRIPPLRTTVIVSALGPDGHGLLAQVATTIADCNANVDDVSQTVANGMFTMIMFVSFDQGDTTIAELKEALTVTGERIGLQISVQHENIFKFMHRV